MSNNKDSLQVNIKQHKTVLHQPQRTLLESIEVHQIDVHFHCREGYCGACRTKLLSGKVEYPNFPLAYIDDDEILPCCCYPTTDIEIELA
ncbi:MAG: class I ribonucleotide reductase maintenance protein YfaE [Paraglaciecola sp.]|uniref:class I ribonucleotide reductase maintenance protein YfaE n=1 Tax=Pseudomonadati TaxID=3379134 RepID=UPI00273FD6BF|nr:class I ribonucleotide reductase maintenance protein YfaE [Paraglaciecola sp.]MDP5031040.1 class I ribonucleotide reductase maintenance protein YfaE [Paraglaciecola sp.]MDP5131343.1 class I ribonucleotide reductase maintenance protein YfaE [Paraglaciecola sp.]